MVLLEAIVLLVDKAIMCICGGSKRTELSLITNRLVGSFTPMYVCDQTSSQDSADITSNQIIIGQGQPVLKFQVLYSAIVRNSEKLEKTSSLCKLVKQEAIPQFYLKLY